MKRVSASAIRSASSLLARHLHVIELNSARSLLSRFSHLQFIVCCSLPILSCL
uniref:Uncharacterized protein n=1 Tax=Kalanchoe fedtschenkoi TaxID=63787 RepID=A0A7N0T2J2_KALFE